jgi:hypothetical protein
LKALPESEAQQIALQHQLLSPYTACYALAERDVKAQDLPQLRVTPHMLAAGWGGAGSVLSADAADFSPPLLQRKATRQADEPAPLLSIATPDLATGAIKSGAQRSVPQPQSVQPRAFAEALNAQFGGLLSRAPCPATIAELGRFGLPGDIVAGLRRLRDQGWDEETVAVGFLKLFAQHMGTGLLSRNSTRAITQAAKRAALPAALLEKLAPCMAGLTAAEWNWVAPAGVPDTTSDATRQLARRDDSFLDIPAFLRKQAD